MQPNFSKQLELSKFDHYHPIFDYYRHWISKHSSDFWSDERLSGMTMDFLKEIESSPGLLPAEHKSAAQLLRLLERAPDRSVDLVALFVPPRVS